MRLNWNFLGLAMFVALALGSAGCSGINASQSVSPASFFLPGIMKADPQCVTNAPFELMQNSTEVAAVR